MQETTQSVQAPDWDLIKSLYISGLTPKRIEERTGVKAGLVSVRANRGKWKETMHKTASVLKAPGLNHEQTTHDTHDSCKIASKSEKVRQGLALRLEQAVALVQDSPVTSIARELALQDKLEPLVRNAKAVFGWSEQSAQPLVRINILANASVVSIESKHSLIQGQIGQGEGGQPLSWGGAVEHTPPQNFPSFETLAVKDGAVPPQNFPTFENVPVPVAVQEQPVIDV